MPTKLKFNPDVALQFHLSRLKLGFTTILKDINFELKSGEVLAILGPNGAGKTSILKSIAGMFPIQGSCTIFGSDKRTSEVKKQIGYLGHETFLYEKLTANENLIFFARLYGVNNSVESLLKKFSLFEASHQLVESFSRGMKQRLALARTMIADPGLLLLDEPFTGLDLEASVLLESTISSQKGQTAIVFTTHDLARAYDIADQFLILKNGRQVFRGTKDEIPTGIDEFYRSLTS